MVGVFFLFLFGVAVGMGLFPHVQHLIAQVRWRLAELEELEQSKGPSPWS